MEKTMMEKTIYVTINDYNRIMGMIEQASLKYKIPQMVDSLIHEIKAAKMVPQDNVPNDVITMNSRALLKDLVRGAEVEITITYPESADNKKGRISVFTPIGTALIGARAGDIVSWKVPHGIGRFRIEKIIYQPEAVGDFHL